MKKTIAGLGLIVITFIGTSAFMYKYSTGIAGYAGSPGETSCSNQGCHSGGTSSASGITITATPSFTNDEYVPGTSYTISVAASADGFSHYGFGCEILNGENSSIGTMATVANGGVKFLNAGSKRNAVHTTPKAGNSVVFSFKWTAPAEGEGSATIYAAANAVNLNGQPSGDFPIAPVSMLVGEGAVPVFTGIQAHETNAYQVSVYPNPAIGSANISYALTTAETVSIELMDISGKTVKSLITEKQTPGDHSAALNLQGVTAGVYFVKLSVNGQKAAQKLITVQ